MNAEIKRRFVERLRANTDPQTRAGLRDCKGFCVLGVLCDVVDKDGWEELAPDGEWSHRGHGGYPAASVLQEAGLSLEDAYTLSGMNDDRWAGNTFPKLADYIEQFL